MPLHPALLPQALDTISAFHGPKQVAGSTQLPEDVPRSLRLGRALWRAHSALLPHTWKLHMEGPAAHPRVTMRHVAAMPGSSLRKTTWVPLGPGEVVPTQLCDLFPFHPCVLTTLPKNATSPPSPSVPNTLSPASPSQARSPCPSDLQKPR